MTDRVRQDSQVEIRAATLEEKPILSNLVELYVHDFSEFIGCVIGPDGRFGYQHLDEYWTDPLRFPFLIYVNSELAGFLLVNQIARGGGTLWDMAEFFVLRGYRRSSIGTRVAHHTFARFTGAWQVRVMESNRPACAFWDRAVRAFAGEEVVPEKTTAEDKRWIRFSFNSPPKE